jgi:hypothetical protein
MAYILDGSTIRSPNSIKESNSTQVAQHRTLDGSVSRDYFGDNKRVWVLDYQNVQKVSYDAIKTIYDAYLATATAQTWEITETNYTISQTSVHIDLLERGFSVKGEDYISDFTLILTEA